jgi:hypothetical protein
MSTLLESGKAERTSPMIAMIKALESIMREGVECDNSR